MSTQERIDIEELKNAYLDNIISGKRAGALEVAVQAHSAGLTIPKIYGGVLRESLYEVGRLWETNKLTVADEHRSTAITQFVMSNLYLQMEIEPEFRGNAVITGIEGEMHQIGANMAADILESFGWNVMFLGTNVPQDSVIQAIRGHNARLIGISVTMFFNFPKVMQLIQAVREQFNEQDLKILIGGRGVKMITPKPAELADCFVGYDIEDIISLAKSL